MNPISAVSAPPPAVVTVPVPITAVLDYGAAHNAALSQEFIRNGGPGALVTKYILPAVAAGWSRRFLVRFIPLYPIDRAWLRLWAEIPTKYGCEAAIYTRGDELSEDDVYAIRDLNVPIVLENWGMGPCGWQIGAMASRIIASEPARDRAAPAWVPSVPAVISDDQWKLGYVAPRSPTSPAGWSADYQVPPWATRCRRWFQGQYADLPAWYAGCVAALGNSLEDVIVGADAAGLGWTANKIRGT